MYKNADMKKSSFRWKKKKITKQPLCSRHCATRWWQSSRDSALAFTFANLQVLGGHKETLNASRPSRQQVRHHGKPTARRNMAASLDGLLQGAGGMRWGVSSEGRGPRKGVEHEGHRDTRRTRQWRFTEKGTVPESLINRTCTLWGTFLCLVSHLPQ